MVGGDNLRWVYPYIVWSPNFANVGEYTVHARYSPNPNYDITVVDATLNIIPRPVTVTIDNKEKTYGDEDPELTYSIDNLAFDDTLDITLAREEGEDVGTYDITATLEENDNYIVTVVGENDDKGIFTINPKKIIIKVDDASKTVGEKDPEFTVTITDLDGNPLDPDEVKLKFAREEGEAVGTYKIFAAINNPNYVIDEDVSSDGVLTINPVKAVADTPVTGDNAHLILWFVVMLLAMVAMLSLVVINRKRKTTK